MLNGGILCHPLDSIVTFNLKVSIMSAEDYVGRDCDLSEEYNKPEMEKDNGKEWVSAMDKKDTRTDKEILIDFYENGFC